jgi:HlyD family secretion protein
MKSIVLPIIASGSLVLAGASLVGHLPQRELTEAPSPPPESSFPSSVAGVGLVEACTENIAVGTHIAGIVQKVFVSVGHHVSVGDPLFEIDNRHLRAQLEFQRAALGVASAELADLENQLGRAERLARQKVISIDELDRNRFAARTLRARVLQAEAAIKASETDIARSRVTAPLDGKILKLNVRTGEFAPAGATSEPLLLMGSLAPLHLRVDVDEQDAWRVQPQAKAIASVRGNSSLQTILEFVRFEPYVMPKRSLTGDSTERVDTRVLQVIYRFHPDQLPIHVGQQMDVFIEAPPVSIITSKKLSVPNPLPFRQDLPRGKPEVEIAEKAPDFGNE